MPEISDQEKPSAAGRPCPICGKPSTAKDRPFCSKRCADIDLHHWLKGSYALPAAPASENDETVSEGEAPLSKDRD